MNEDDKSLIKLLHPFILKAPRENIKRRDSLYLALHGIYGCYTSHSDFQKKYRMYGGWSSYIIYFALKWPHGIVDAFSGHISPLERKCVSESIKELRNYNSEIPKEKVSEALEYQRNLKDCRYQLPLKKLKYFEGQNSYKKHDYVYTPQKIFDFYNDIYQKDCWFYGLKMEELFNLEQIDYKDYLNSPFWYVIRYTVLYRDSHTCRLCGENAEVVHHHDYSRGTLYGMNLDALVSLCHSCHEQIEFDNGDKIICQSRKREKFDELLEKYLHSNETISQVT